MRLAQTLDRYPSSDCQGQGWASLAAVAIVAILATIAVALDWDSPLRVVLVLLFLVFGPGLAIAELLRIRDPVAQIALATAASLAIETIVAVTCCISRRPRRSARGRDGPGARGPAGGGRAAPFRRPGSSREEPAVYRGRQPTDIVPGANVALYRDCRGRRPPPQGTDYISPGCSLAPPSGLRASAESGRSTLARLTRPSPPRRSAIQIELDVGPVPARASRPYHGAMSSRDTSHGEPLPRRPAGEHPKQAGG